MGCSPVPAKFLSQDVGSGVYNPPAAMDGPKPSYTQEEVNEILRRALSQEANRESALSHEDLVEIAKEAGIERSSLDQAIADLAQEHVRELARQGEAVEIAAERRLELKRFGSALVSHATLNVFLYLVATRLLGSSFWVWPLLGSGALLALRLRHVIFPYDKVLRRRKRERRQRERERRAALRADWGKRILGGTGPVPDPAKAFEAVVQKGVSALLAVAERKLDEHRAREKRTR